MRDGEVGARRCSIRRRPRQVKVVERGASGNQSVREESRKEKDVFWQPVGVERDIINQGPSMYRQISVEVK